MLSDLANSISKVNKFKAPQKLGEVKQAKHNNAYVPRSLRCEFIAYPWRYTSISIRGVDFLIFLDV